MPVRWSSPAGVAVLAGLVTFAGLSLLAAVERRGLTWWDPLIIVLVAATATAVVRGAGRR